MNCQTCGIRIQIAPDFEEFMAQMQYHALVEAECIKCAGQRVRIGHNNLQGKALHRVPVIERKL